MLEDVEVEGLRVLRAAHSQLDGAEDVLEGLFRRMVAAVWGVGEAGAGAAVLVDGGGARVGLVRLPGEARGGGVQGGVCG